MSDFSRWSKQPLVGRCSFIESRKKHQTSWNIWISHKCMYSICVLLYVFKGALDTEASTNEITDANLKIKLIQASKSFYSLKLLILFRVAGELKIIPACTGQEVGYRSPVYHNVRDTRRHSSSPDSGLSSGKHSFFS